MAASAGPAVAHPALRRRRRLHPLAILIPFSSYSGPPRLGGGVRIPRWVGLSILLALLWLIDLNSDSVTRTSDGGVLVDSAEFTRAEVLLLMAAIGAGAAFLLARWWSFRWWIEDGAIWTSGGIVNRWQRRVTIREIVVVDRSSAPIRRIFGASRIAIETSAVDQLVSDILLGCLANRDATRLEDLLIRELAFEGSSGDVKRFDPISVDRLGWWDLILSGATTIQITRALVLLYAASRLFEDQTMPSVVIDSENPAYGLSAGQLALLQVLGIVGAVWLASTIYFMASFARFRLGKHEGWLILETGLIRRSRRLIRTDAIQGLEISRSPLQRFFRNKRAMLRMRLPAYGSPPIYAMVLHPAVRDATLPRLTSEIAGMDPATSDALRGKGVLRLAVGSRTAYVAYWPIRIAAGSAALVTMLYILEPGNWWYGLLPLPLVIPFAITGLLAWRSTGWYAGDGGWLMVQQGVFTLTSTAARIDRIKYIQWSQALVARPEPARSLAISVATSGGAGLLGHIRANPSLVRIRAVDAGSARAIAIAGGFDRSLPATTIAD